MKKLSSNNCSWFFHMDMLILSGFLFCIQLLCWSCSANAQRNVPVISWQKSLGKNAEVKSILSTDEGGLITAGSIRKDASDAYDFWISKSDASGNFIWEKSVGGSLDDEANSAQQISNGGFIMAGSSLSNDRDVSGNHAAFYGNTYDYWITRLSPDSELIWQKSLGGSGQDVATSAQPTSDEGFIVAGYSNSNDGDVSGMHPGFDRDGDLTFDAWIVKLDRDGHILWQHCFGGSDHDLAYDVNQAYDGGFVIAGATQSIDGNISSYHACSGNNLFCFDYWIIKLDQDGNLEWEKTLGGSSNDRAYAMDPTSDGGFIISGSSASKDGDVSGNHGNTDAWIVEVDFAGNLIWEKSLGGSLFDAAYSVKQTRDGGIIVSGITHSDDGDVSGNHGKGDSWIVRLNASGMIEWQKCLGGSDTESESYIVEANNGNVVVACSSQSTDGDFFSNSGLADSWILNISCEDAEIYYPDDAVSVQEKNSLIYFSISPNPTNGNTVLSGELEQEGLFAIRVFNIVGKEVFLERDEIGTGFFVKEIDLSHLPTGSYFVQLKSDTSDPGLIRSKKLIIEK